MFGRASGWRAIDSTALLPMIPSPIADPKAAKPTISAKPMMTEATRMAFSMCTPLVSFVGGRSDEVGDRQQREHNGLDRADDEVERIDADRSGVCERRYESEMRDDDDADHEQQHLAGEDIAEEPHRQRDRACEFVHDHDRQHRDSETERLDDQMLEITQPFARDAYALDQQDGEYRARRGRVEI